MPLKLPDPRETAEREAAGINANRKLALEVPLDRVLIDSPFVDRQRLLAGLKEFHKERMQHIPSAVKYPESPEWVDYVLTVDREVQKLANLSDLEIALYRSLHTFLLFRGFTQAAPVRTEKCRVAYLPESDHGRLHIKNLDDPATNWTPEGYPHWLFSKPDQMLWQDGVGNGLHLDDEPDEIFPLPVMGVYRQYVDDVPSAVEFLTRYSKFWGNANILLHDRQKRSVAIEKSSYNFIEVFQPGADGRSYISGMTCRDPHSPQGRYQRSQRQKYLKIFNQPDDCADNAFWGQCWQFEQKLRTGLAGLGKQAKLDDLIRLFITPWPGGLNQTGQRIHPEQGLIGYTLISYVCLLDKNQLWRWQRSASPDLTYPDKPEVFDY